MTEIQNNQNLDLKDFLSLKFETIGKDIARLDGKYTEFERKNCDKHTIIQAMLSSYQGKMEEKLEQLKEKVITREQYDRHLESQTGRNMMMQKDIKENSDNIETLEKEQIKVDGKIKNILIYFSIIGTAIMIAIDIARKRLGI